ncbi:uncharacterized protein LOC129582380 [Paramacrobiotus metropolitanus]|uniref:uncharacterized protein LOC129582380 n=1 Tax=Paramacrobiotus metropolitanus TaxID=2943436 RepID=UPI0024465D54|nr:uncharacterized protein LOC129582380 [Paramacrobiotus metropolitanus]
MVQYITQQIGNIRLDVIRIIGARCCLHCDHSYLLDDRRECLFHRADAETAVGEYRNKVGVRWGDFTAACRGLPCDTLQLINFEVNLDYTNEWTEGDVSHWTPVMEITTPRIKVNADFDGALWEGMNAGLAVTSGRKQQTLAQWLKGNTADPLTSTACKILCATQTADPRSSLQYRGKKWCWDGIKDLRVAELSSLAQHFLMKLQESFGNPGLAGKMSEIPGEKRKRSYKDTGAARQGGASAASGGAKRGPDAKKKPDKKDRIESDDDDNNNKNTH